MEETTGRLIARLRAEKGLTQKRLAEALSISDKTVSKWERDGGLPDVSILPALSAALGVGVDALLSGGLDSNEEVRGNMKKLKFYVCPDCGNIITAAGDADISCCGRRIAALVPREPDEAHDLAVETVEDEWFVSSAHPMEREHYIQFVALLLGDRAELVRAYPEWDLQARFFKRGRGVLAWYCTSHGLFGKSLG